MSKVIEGIKKVSFLYGIGNIIIFSLKFDCEKLAQEKIEVHRQYVMVNYL